MAIEHLIEKEIERTEDESTKIFFTAIVQEITKLRRKIIKLQERSDFLSRLEAAGVDNWEGYSEAFDGDEDEDD